MNLAIINMADGIRPILDSDEKAAGFDYRVSTPDGKFIASFQFINESRKVLETIYDWYTDGTISVICIYDPDVANVNKHGP